MSLLCAFFGHSFESLCEERINEKKDGCWDGSYRWIEVFEQKGICKRCGCVFWRNRKLTVCELKIKRLVTDYLQKELKEKHKIIERLHQEISTISREKYKK